MLVRLVAWMLGLVIVWALIAIPYLNIRLLSGPGTTAVAVSLALTLVWLAVLGGFGSRLAKWLGRRGATAERIGLRSWLLLVMAIATGLRFAWWGVFHAPLSSDAATYFSLAVQLVEQGGYGGARSGFAYWPPGLPFFLAPFVAVFGPQPWTVLVANLILTCLTVFLTYRIAKPVASEAAARLASLFMAIWPNLVMSAGLASKEQLILALFLGALALYLKGDAPLRNRSNVPQLFGTGLLLGAATLTQPSFMLFPGVIFLAELLRGAGVRRALLRLILVGVGLAAVVAPWSLRNYQVFGQLVPVSTNGGDVLYRANNPLATGGWTERGEIDLSHLGELEKNSVGYQLAEQWITANVTDFLSLAVEKQILFLGDDSDGAYWTLKRGMNSAGLTYFIFKGISNAFWLLIWILCWVGWLSRRADYCHTPTVMLVVLSVLYFLAIDSVFESGARHHVPVTGVLAVLAALAFSALPRH